MYKSNVLTERNFTMIKLFKPRSSRRNARGTIFFAYEVASRELENLLAISEYLRTKGYDVVLGPQLLLLEYLKNCRTSHIVVIKSADSGKYSTICKLKENGHKVCILEAEGILINPIFFAKTRIDPRLIKKIDRYFCAGAYQASLVEKEYPEMQRQVRVIGSAKLLEYGYSPKENSQVTKGLQKRKCILFCSGYSFWNHYMGQGSQIQLLEGYIQNQSTQRKARTYFKKYELHAQKSILRFGELIYELSLRRPDLDIAIRVHPSESDKFWKGLASICPNTTVTNSDNSIDKAINKANLLVTHPSTVLFEAYNRGVNTICFEPSLIDVSETNYPNMHPQTLASVYCRSLEEFLTQVERLIDSDHIKSEEAESLMKEIAVNSDRHDKFLERLHEEINELHQDPSNHRLSTSLSIFSAFRILVSGYKELFIYTLRRIASHDLKSITYGRKKRRVDTGILKNHKLTRLGPGIFCLRGLYDNQ